MSLNQNPFFILKLSCAASRREIMAAVEEMGFVLDSSVCLTAQNELINPAKRLASELDWFAELDEEQLQSIIEKIENGEEIDTDAMASLSKLNATVHNFSVSTEQDIYELGFAILDIDEQYNHLDIKQIATAITECRSKAKIAPATENDVAAGINNKRDNIRQVISERLSDVDQESYVELITMLAEKLVSNDYEDGIVLSDVIDQYEVRMQSQIEESTANVQQEIASIQEMANNDAIDQRINSLIHQVKEWDKLAQPLQLKSQACGLPHEISEHLGIQLRKLAVFLHNEKGKTKEALSLVEAMKDVFAELGGLSDLFESDSDALNDLLRGEQDAKVIVDELDAIKKQSESLKAYATSASVDTFINKIKAFNAKIKSTELDSETQEKLRQSICFIARETAIELHNSKHQTELALKITTALCSEFGDIPFVRTKLSEDTAILQQQLTQARINEKANNTGCIARLIVVGIIIVIIACVSLFDSKPSSSNNSGTTKQTSSYSSSTTNSKNTSSSSTSSSSATTKKTEMDKQLSEIKAMEITLTGLGSDIDNYEEQLDDLASDLDYYEAQYYATGNNTYYNSYYSTLDEYNDLFDEYEDAVNDYNALYTKYSNAIDDYNSKIG